MFRVITNLLIIISLSSACFSHAEDQITEIKIGVRNDAYPMSYKLEDNDPALVHAISGPLRKKGYAGYIVYLCDRVLIEMERSFGTSFKVTEVPVIARDRFKKLEENEFDILCDPSTATKERLDGLISSPPVFITGTSYAIRPSKSIEDDDCGSIIGIVNTSEDDNSTASPDRIINRLLSMGELSTYKEILVSFIDKPEDENSLKCDGAAAVNKKREPPIVYMDTHTQVVDAFCSDQIKIYIGDIEIVSQKLRRRTDCIFTGANTTFGDDRYVILGKVDSANDNKAFFISQFFGTLSKMIFFKPSILDEAFERSFLGAKKSKKLESLYWGLRG